jgi:hypothetical protein
MRIVFSAGRFNGPTIEHHKLIQKNIEQPGDFHYIFIFGPKTIDHTNFKNPFTIEEKYSLLCRLYPENSHIFVKGDGQYTTSPNQCLCYAWHHHRHGYPVIDLTIVAGEGMGGIEKSDEGGSINSYRSIIRRLNKTNFETGDIRMYYENVDFVANPRGSISSRIMREYAMRNDVNNNLHVKKFQSMLHPDISLYEAKVLMQKIQERGYNGLSGVTRKSKKDS